MPRRTPETLADYLVVAVCPTLIGLLVGSLMFFLVEVFYQGEYPVRLLFVMAMFVMAIVCVARIAMEEGMQYASLFAFPLAIVVGLALVRFISVNPLINWALMAIVWWATHKLTWDCTLVDDTQDASGQGLLQQMGLDPSAAASPSGPPGTTALASELEATIGAAVPSRPWWETLLEPDRRPHAPGVWVVYFSLAALPLFGIGGWFVPAADPDARRRVFLLLVVYVACGLALLLATSFLGLRRYLRQRRLEMPLEMTATWVTVGVAMILAMLILATILPRPSAEYSLSQLPFAFTSAVRQASRYAVGPEGTRDSSNDPQLSTTAAKEGQQTAREGSKTSSSGKGDNSQGKTEPTASSARPGKGSHSSERKSGSEQGGSAEGKGQSSRQRQDGPSSGKQGQRTQNGEPQGGQSGRGDRSDSSESSRGGKESDSSSGSRQGSQPPASNGEQDAPSKGENQSIAGSHAQPEARSLASSSSTSQSLANLATRAGQTLGTLLKWLFYAVLLVGGLTLGWIYREELLAAWQKLLEELRELWAGWFDRKPTTQDAAAVTPAAAPRPFAAFADPFASGAAARMSWPDLVRYTFAAVEAWAREHECPRQQDQTPHEFAQALGLAEPQIAGAVQALAGAYNQLAYAPRSAARGAVEPLRQLWRDLHDADASAAAVSS
jgi:Domain of unknown function (DUF4129)